MQLPASLKAVGVSAFALVTVFSTPASAETIYTENAHNPGGKVPCIDYSFVAVDASDLPTQTGDQVRMQACFERGGDKFWIRDTSADGYHPALYGYFRGGPDRKFWCHNYKGAGSGWKVCTGFHDKIPENKNITLIPQLFDGDKWITSGWVREVSTG
ncbi:MULTISPECIES: hypothetical protein [Actinomadura]|uniref:Secreted protein n=1 Tax=Actinomadura madurae TaxID=1993 RepID=A0A1I5M989_9ACTN|nr:hypothetical protein [Actinomadura madurae]SFP06162.1 hypothetical protein SAMN04489713_111210 [Actinomadura madurae]